MKRPLELTCLPKDDPIMKYVDHLETLLHGLQPNTDYYWEYDDWEYTVGADDLPEMLDPVGPYDIMKVGRAAELPPKWVAGIPLTFDEHGDWDEWEKRWFNTEEEAHAAVQAARAEANRKCDDL